MPAISHKELKMKEVMQTLCFNVTDPIDTATVGANGFLTILPYDYTIIYVSVSPMEDDTGATIDLQDDGTDIITAIDASDHDVPGEWISTAAGGAQTPVHVAAGSELEVDFNNAAAGNRFDIMVVILTGSSWG